MNVANNIKMDLTKPDLTVSVHAVQGDAYTRTLQIALYCGLQPWTVPEDATVAVRYAKPDHTKGLYAALPDGTCAWSVQENILTVALAPQMLTVPGNVKVQIILSCGDQVLSTFGLIVHVEANPAIDVLHSENYFNWPQWVREQAAEQVALARQASESAAGFLKETQSIAEHVSAIVAGNEAYTKSESDHRYAPVILQSASGSSIQLSDTRNFTLLGLRIFGKTTQDGTPTPDAPAEMVNAGNGGSITVSVGTSAEDTELQTYTFLTPNGLPGIPMDSGGNYTDENGQQWVCDEIDFARGVYVQRIGRITGEEILSKKSAVLNATENGYSQYLFPSVIDGLSANNSTKRALCSHLEITREVTQEQHIGFWIYNGTTICFVVETETAESVEAFEAWLTSHSDLVIQYMLATPIETPLSAEQLVTYDELHTNYPNTTIINDAGAWMKVEYIADTKLYIDKKFDQLAAAMLNQ